MGNNLILLKNNNGSLTRVEKVPEFNIEFLGENSKLIIGEGSIYRNSSIKLDSHSNVTIEKTAPRGINNLVINMGGSPNSELVIGKGFSIEGGYVGMANEDSLSIRIGEDCMCSSSILVTATDGHTIYDKDTKKVVNHANPITIGNHVWVSHSVTILKGASISDDSIIGACSVVTKKFRKKNIILAGNPAKVVKESINWDKRSIDRYVDEENMGHVSLNSLAMLDPVHETNSQLNVIQTLACRFFGIIFSPFYSSGQLEKLRNMPVAFFQDSQSVFTRTIGKFLRII